MEYSVVAVKAEMTVSDWMEFLLWWGKMAYDKHKTNVYLPWQMYTCQITMVKKYYICN